MENGRVDTRCEEEERRERERWDGTGERQGSRERRQSHKWIWL